jgi:hypothetical protein
MTSLRGVPTNKHLVKKALPVHGAFAQSDAA